MQEEAGLAGSRQKSLVELMPGRALHMACNTHFDMKASTSSRSIQHRRLSAGCAGLEVQANLSSASPEVLICTLTAQSYVQRMW